MPISKDGKLVDADGCEIALMPTVFVVDREAEMQTKKAKQPAKAPASIELEAQRAQRARKKTERCKSICAVTGEHCEMKAGHTGRHAQFDPSGAVLWSGPCVE